MGRARASERVNLTIESTARLTRRAQELGFAVPAINVVDDLSLRAVIAAAEVTSAPIIVQVSVKTLRSLGLRQVRQMFDASVSSATVPIALHLDHCPNRQVIDEVVRAGWSSVLFDASDRDLAQAEAETRDVVAQAHSTGVDVESEIENVIGVEDGVGSDVALHAYTVDELVGVAERTGADLLAPQLGTAHGMYKTAPELLPERARELANRTGRPIVLHGGTGLTDGDFRSFIEAGVSKINISTALKHTYMQSALVSLNRSAELDKWDPPTLFKDISDALQQMLVEHIEQFGAAGRANSVRAA